jgi:hypothetical protein
MDNVKVKKLNVFSYLLNENKLFIVAIIGLLALVKYAFSEYKFPAVLIAIAFIYFRFNVLNKLYSNYSINGNKKYSIISKLVGTKLNRSTGRYDDNSKSDVNYLEDFLLDFNFCNWDDMEEVTNFKFILGKVTPNHIPNSDNNELTLSENDRDLTEAYEAMMESYDDNEKLKEKIADLRELLSDVNRLRFSYNMDRF